MFDGQSIVGQSGRLLGLIQRFECKTGLDFGCGKAEYYGKPDKNGQTLQNALLEAGLEKITLYDPAVPDFSAEPVGPFDAVWATDVLEHIPEDSIFGVVDRLFGLAGKVVLVSVACYEARKTLPNGQNAHLTVKPPAFWAEVFAKAAEKRPEVKYKLVCRETPEKDEVFGNAHVHSGPMVLKMKSKNCVDVSEIQKNMRETQAALIPWVMPCKPHAKRAILIGGAPSLPDSLEEIKADVAAGGVPVCVKASHDWLIANGVIPRLCSMLDPRPHVKDWVQNPHSAVTYLVASMIHPNVARHLAARRAKVRLYHAAVGAEEAKYALGGLTIAGGSTSGLRATHALTVMGFRRFKFYGFDSSYRDDGVDKIGSAHSKRPRNDYLWARPEPRGLMEIEIVGQAVRPEVVADGERWYYTDPELLCQVRDLEVVLGMMRGCEFEFGGDGLFQAYGRMWLDRQREFPSFEEMLA